MRVCNWLAPLRKAMLLLIVVIGPPAQAAALPELLPMWDASDESNQEDFDHSAWDELLKTHLDTIHESGINLFDYAGLRASAADMERLKNYLLSQTALDPRTRSRDVQMAYWINLYNALTVWVVVNDYPVDSIKDIKSGLFIFGPWQRELITVAGQSLTLDNIEHNILRPIWKDPRIHYAVNCASLGCPNLAEDAYRADNLEALLEKGAREYINHPRGAQVRDGELHLSSIYEWFQVDFGDSLDGVIAHLQKYANPELFNALRQVEEFHHDYDWKLNAP